MGLRHPIDPGVCVLWAYVFRPINTKQEAQAAALNATPSLEGGICPVVSALLVRVESPAHHGSPGVISFNRRIIMYAAVLFYYSTQL